MHPDRTLTTYRRWSRFASVYNGLFAAEGVDVTGDVPFYGHTLDDVNDYRVPLGWDPLEYSGPIVVIGETDEATTHGDVLLDISNPLSSYPPEDAAAWLTKAIVITQMRCYDAIICLKDAAQYGQRRAHNPRNQYS